MGTNNFPLMNIIMTVNNYKICSYLKVYSIKSVMGTNNFSLNYRISSFSVIRDLVVLLYLVLRYGWELRVIIWKTIALTEAYSFE